MAIQIYYDPMFCGCKNVRGAVYRGETLQLNIFNIKNNTHFSKYAKKNSFPTSEDCEKPLQKAFLKINKDGQDVQTFLMQQTDFGWHISLKLKEIGLYYYFFNIEGEGNVYCGYMEKGELGRESDSFLLTVCSEDYVTPDWFKGGVLYQIFPDRFYREGTMPDIKRRILRKDWGGEPSHKPNAEGKVLNNDFFGGNFKGIESKLPYLKELGVTTIYLNPIFEAASNHRYDTSNYMNTDPLLGTSDDLKSLINSAKKQDIRIILDGVFNHTGDDSVYFNKYGHYDSLGAYQSKESPYYDWYSFQSFPDRYSSWWGIDILPEINENSEDYQNFIFGNEGVLKHWLSLGIGGYRLDVADELPDFFLKKLRKSVKEKNSDAIIIGEVWEDASNKIAYSKRREYLQGYELDSVMNYPLKDAIIHYIQTEKATDLLHCIRVLNNHYPKQTLDCLMNILGTHDTARILTVLGGIYCVNKDEMASSKAYLSPENKEKAIQKLKMAAILQYTMPGVPCIYYGDENAAEGHIDPFCRRCFDWAHLNKELISFYSILGKIRKDFRNIFKDGIFQEIYIDEGLIFYKRKKESQNIYIYVNNSAKEYLLNIPDHYKSLLKNENYLKQILIKPYSYNILKKV